MAPLFCHPATVAIRIYQLVKHRQQSNTRKITHHQSHGNRKSLVIKNSTGNSTHKHQRHKHGNCCKRRTKHRCNYFRCTQFASLLKRFATGAVLRDILGNHNGTIYHHAQSKDQTRQRYNVQRHLKNIEKQQTDYQTYNHTQPNHRRTLYIP